MTGIEDQIIACLRKTEPAQTADIACQIGVSTQFVQSLIDNLTKEGRIVRSGDAGYALSQNEERRLERYKRLEERRRPFVRW